MKNKNRALALILAVFMALTCAGCAAAGADSLYALPQLSDEYVQLESLIAQQIEAGGEYAAPLGGSNRQSVQLHDLDGDGTTEAVAFLADSTHTPMVCVYCQDPEGNYFLFVTIEGAGFAVDSVEYADLTGDGAREIILTWQVGGDIRLLSVYALSRENQTQLLSADCSEFVVCDLDGDGVEEILDLRIDYSAGSAITRYAFQPNGSVSESRAMLSSGITEVCRARTGYLSDGATALFVESRWDEDELITDVLTAGSAGLTNITLGASGRSNTLRTGDAFAADINADRVMEIPESAGDILNWYSVDSAGRKSLALTSYHSFDGGWYLALPEAFMSGVLTVRREENVTGETSVVFSLDRGDGPRDALVIYTFTGENRRDRAGEKPRFLLAEEEDAVFAAEILAEDLLTKDEIENCFNRIYPEWQTGDLG